jgi:FtsP/CotA-like multicopper oxidase with cupredoxin domain
VRGCTATESRSRPDGDQLGPRLVPGETAEVAIRFTDHPGRYVFHCHNLEHEDMAMMANFSVS